MLELTEFEALQKLFDTTFDSNLEDVLNEDELEAIRRNGATLDNLKSNYCSNSQALGILAFKLISLLISQKQFLLNVSHMIWI